MKVQYGHLTKPLESDCKLYCRDYATCTLTECNRKKMFTEHSPIYMGEEVIVNTINKKMKWNRWQENADCMLNNDYFTRRVLAK